MGIDTQSLTPTQESLFLTLGLRAIDATLEPPFLGDQMAAQVAQASGFDMSRFPLLVTTRMSPRVKATSTSLRTKLEDEVVTRFVRAYPDAVVLDLGAGLDTRAFRINPPATVDWYDVDFPAVIDLRHQLIPKRAHTHTVSTDITDVGWLNDIPADRPTMIVHDGLVPFLTMGDYQELQRRLTRHFTSGGEIVHNNYTKPAVWTLKLSRVFPDVPGTGFNDARAPETWGAGLELVEEIFVLRSPELEYLTMSRFIRSLLKICARSATLCRQLEAAALHYRFGAHSPKRVA
ncbi:O-methyltransferase [Mycobacteroides abscessus subsp. massiliense]|uniref:class I SAM-dependent methyltransferase n=1 Tax=Mycobacteroides abscessus TaxID=36809 RepID=UPI0009CA670E|nr:class I SAM-dependent methyltransferase [Mycobacteroides abscessus]SKU60275.1 O-methyltransferase [Mycobacteroides abscessus subsp. massiliense]